MNNNTDFLRPLVTGKVVLVAEPLIQGSVQPLWLVIINRADDGIVVARCQVRLQNVPLNRKE